MRLNIDPMTGKTPRTQGNITRITGLQMDDRGKVAAGHPHLQKPEAYTDARKEFVEGLRLARQKSVANGAGSLAARLVVHGP